MQDDDEPDETQPLVGPPPGAASSGEQKPPTWAQVCSMLHRMRWILLLGTLNTVLMRAESVVYFPYMRTLQHCATPVDPAKQHTSEWSGSDHCGDRKLVTREAQAIVGYGRGAGLVAHCLFMPFLGRLGDVGGRRVLVIIHFVGMLVESLINAATPKVPVFMLGCFVRGALSGLWPALMSMTADVIRPDDRILAYGILTLSSAVIGAVAFVCVTRQVLTKHWANYGFFWLVLASLSGAGCLLGCVCPETLPPDAASQALHGTAATARPRSARARLYAFAQVVCAGRGRGAAGSAGGAAGGAGGGGRLSEQLLFTNPVLRFLLTLCSPLVVAVAAFTTIDGWAVLAFGWQQETVNYVKFAAAPAAILSLSLALPLQRRLGNANLIRLGVSLITGAMVLMALAEFNVVLFVLALLLMGLASCLAPAVLLLLSTQAPPSQQASTQATFSAIIHGLAAGALAMHGALFKAGGELGYVSLPFAVGAVMVFGVLYHVLFAMPQALHDDTAAGGASIAQVAFVKARGV